MDSATVFTPLLALAGLFFLYKLVIRLRLSRAKHPSVRGHAKWSRRLARLVPFYSLEGDRFYACDGAPEDIARQRRGALNRIRTECAAKNEKSLAYAKALVDGISDVRFTGAYRVPFPFRSELPEELKASSVLDASDGVRVRDLDGNWRYDLAGSYGVNVFGYDFYKRCIAAATARAGELGPVLGAYHPVVADNVERLKRISGLEEVSFHMSGTEAVMQAVRLARYHTGRSHLVRFCGAYHGWWDGVQPGVGNDRKVNDVYTLEEMSEQALRVIATRKDIACVLVNPLQGLSPNADAPGDATLMSSQRNAAFDRRAYTEWLQRLRETCRQNNIVFILDEVLTGFRLGYRGAQGFFDLSADLVTYGKTLGGGLPVGVLCGKATLMRRFRDEQPAYICFARGTFNAHPYVMTAMNEFLQQVEKPWFQQVYSEAASVWDARAALLNTRLQDEGLPVRVAHLHSIYTVLYTRPSRYNWMFQFYLRNENLELSWVGSGRMIFSLNYTDEDFHAVTEAFVSAAREMLNDGWWWEAPGFDHRAIRRQLVGEMVAARFPLLARPKRPKSAPVASNLKERTS